MRTLEDLEIAMESGLRAWESVIVERHAARMGQKIVREVKRKTPVDSGNLRRRFFSGVQQKKREINIVVSNDAEYAAPVNNGHRVVRGGRTVGKVSGAHMLEKGIMTYQSSYLAEDVQAMLDDLRGALR